MPDLDAIRARADKATPGPWYPVVNDLVGGWSCSTVNAPASHGPAPTPADFCSLDDADFIAHARADVLALLAEIERLREALAHAQATIGLATTYIPAARFGEFVNRRAALAEEPRAAQESAE